MQIQPFLIAGVDEVGRGPLAGPVVAAAVILDPQRPIPGLLDSKLLNEATRERLDVEIRRHALAFCIAEASVEEIDTINILHASMLAMARAVEGLSIQPNLALIDGNRCPAVDCPSQAIVKGDQKVLAISAASIIAKVARDRMMVELHAQFPQYGFAGHKGYPTAQHRQAIIEHGVTALAPTLLPSGTRGVGNCRQSIGTGRRRMSTDILEVPESSVAELSAAKPPPFVHLSVHTEFSLVDSTIRIKPLAKLVAQSMPAAAVTDRCNMFSLVKYYRAAMAAGIKPIAGVDMGIRGALPDGEVSRVILLVQDADGYRNLTNLVSRGYQEGQSDGSPVVNLEWVFEANEGLIALSGGVEGDVGQALKRGHADEAFELATRWQSFFGDRYYLELCRTGKDFEEQYIVGACSIAVKTDIPVVATNDVRFLKAADFSAHETRLCIQSGYVLADTRRPKLVTEEQYLKSAAQMHELFADIPVALENSVEIAKRCNLTLKLGTPVLPDFPIPEGMTETEFFYASAEEGLEIRLKQLYDTNRPDFAQIREPYDARLKRELDVIAGMGFPGYFLIVADFIKWSRNNRYSRWAGTWLGCGLAGGLRSDDHRPGPTGLRSAVRAIPEP